MSTQRDELGKLVHDMLTGVETALPKGVRSLRVGGTVYSISHLVRTLREHESLWTNTENLNAAFHAAVQARESKGRAIHEFMTDLKHAIVAALGSRNPELTKFGLQPRKPRRKLTSDELARATAKARATRKERDPTERREEGPIVGYIIEVGTPASENGTSTEKTSAC